MCRLTSFALFANDCLVDDEYKTLRLFAVSPRGNGAFSLKDKILFDDDVAHESLSESIPSIADPNADLNSALADVFELSAQSTSGDDELRSAWAAFSISMAARFGMNRSPPHPDTE